MTTTFSCPGCGTPLTTGTPKCRSCGIRLVGELAGQLWLVDQELVALRARRDGLLTALRRDEPEPLTLADPWRPGGAAVGDTPVASGPGLLRSAPAGVETRTALLSLGASCLVAALVAGTALLWSSLGATGQAVVMLAVTAGLLAAAVRLRRLPATAEALAAVGVAAVGIDLVAGKSLGVPLLHGLSDRAYWTLGAMLALLCLSAIAVARRELVSPSVGATVAAIGALTSVGWPTTVGDVAFVAAVAVVGTVALLRWSAELPVNPAAVRATAAPAAVAAAVTGLLAAAISASAHDAAAAWGVAIAAVLALLPEALPSGWSARARRGCAAGAGGVVAWLGLLADTGAWQSHLFAVAVGGVAAVAVLVATPRRRDWQDRAVFAAATVVGLAGAVAQLRLQTLAVEGIGLGPAGWSLLAVAGLVAVVGARSAERTRPAWAALAAGVGLAAVAEIAGGSGGRVVAATTVAITAAVMTLAALTPRRLDARLATVAVGDVVASVAASATVVAGLRLGDDLGQLAVVSAGLAVAAVVAVAILPATAFGERLVPAAVATLYASVAADAVLALHDVQVAEAYVAVPAVTWVLLGAWRMRTSADASSWVLAPGLLVVALPSLGPALEGDMTRQVVLLVAGAAAVMVGAQWRLSAPLHIGATVLATVLLRVVAPHVIGLPRWVTLGTVGAALLMLGATWERRLEDIHRLRAEVAPRVAVLR